MCIAIVKPQGTEISDEYLENCFDNNKDGVGIAYAKDGQLYIIKGIFNKENFIKAVRKAEEIAQGDMLIHCRIGTSGLKDKNNCHPHIINNSLVMIHNGILDIDVPKKNKVSDTVIFIEKYLKKLKKDFVKDESIMKLIEFAIGSNNKFAFLNNKGESFICNYKAGIVEGGIWYSNNSYSYGYNDFFVQDESLEIYTYFQDLIDSLDYEDLYEFGDSPLINMEDYTLEAFSLEKYKNTNVYISLKNYSAELYSMYQEMYNELTYLLERKSA
jgi:predicted glutamine amidotransferase